MRKVPVLVVLVFLSRAILPASPATWYVDRRSAESGDGKSFETAFNMVQKGIDAASMGDTVIVAQGRYLENIRFQGKNITVTSTDPLDAEVVANTIIDGRAAGSVVAFDGTEDETCLLCGFTIRNGKAQNGAGICGGTIDNHTRASIRDNFISGNSATSEIANLYFGGGVAFCDGLIEGNTITGNRADYGGGLGRCNGMIRNNTITGNSVTRGGGLFHCDGTVRNNLVANNSGTTSGGGFCGCGGTVENNRIFANSAPSGGGLFGSHGVIRSNLITANSAGKGGGINWCNGTIENNTIAGNTADQEGGGLVDCNGTIRNCIIWGNSALLGDELYNSYPPAYCCIQGWTEGGGGNTGENPCFLYGSYRLTYDSPCVDAGHTEDWMWDAVDLAGNPRILPRMSYWRVDMGAYEYVSPALKPAMIARQGENEVWVIRINHLGESCLFWSARDLTNGPWQEELNVTSGAPLTILKDACGSIKQKFYKLEIQ